MERQVLVVCTANLCRSPVAAALLARQLNGAVDARWAVSSAGTLRHRAEIDPDTVAAAAAVGLQLEAHEPQVLTADQVEAADLVLAMTREHLREVVALVPGAWPKTFTLRELARRAAADRPADGWGSWLLAVGAGRRAADLIGPSPADDVADPYHLGRAANDAMVAEVAALTVELVAFVPWSLGG